MEQINGEERFTLACPVYDENCPDWFDRSWTVFEFDALDWEEFGDEAGVFAFAKTAGEDDGIPAWDLLYIGESDNFAKELPDHPKWVEARALGATHVALWLLYEEDLRTAGRWQWTSTYLPPMNAPYEGAPSFLRCARIGSGRA